ncbi:MAG: HAMP domain-containing sensor histidine kinase, partial [Myxococcota bacterium]
TEATAAPSVLFEGADGRLYKAGYAPVQASSREPEVVLALGVEAPAAFFERLGALQRSLLLYGVLLVVVVLFVSIVVAARITRPVRHLVEAAERIGRGQLHRPVERRSRDEIGFLAETMEEMRRDLQARDERMQLMLAGIAHEVRNPLGGIELFAGILRDELDRDDERRGHVRRIEKELGYLKVVVSDFLDYARRPSLELSRLDLGELVSEVVELVRGEAEAAEVPLELNSATAFVRGDAGQLRRVLLNLIRNAIQAATGVARSWVRVAVRLGRSDGDSGGRRAAAAQRPVIIEVANRGAIIPEETLERIFEPFFTTREKGTGLGLVFVREIIGDHGGQVAVRSGRDPEDPAADADEPAKHGQTIFEITLIASGGEG